ncbi:MAG: porin family protein [Pseudomonadota bacterium]
MKTSSSLRTLLPAVGAVMFFAAPAAAQSFGGPSVGLQLGVIDAETSGAADLSGDDTAIGLRAYFDTDIGGFIVGGGLQYDETDVDLGGVASVDSVFRLGVRGGVDFAGNFVYGTAGFAQANTEAGAADVGDSDGYFLGVGYEVFLTQNITAGAELLYHEFDSFDLDGLEAEATTFNVSVNYRF